MLFKQIISEPDSPAITDKTFANHATHAHTMRFERDFERNLAAISGKVVMRETCALVGFKTGISLDSRSTLCGKKRKK